MTRAICHEAGHTVVALSLGFYVERIEVSKGLPNVKCELGSPKRTAKERFAFLAGGIAGERFFYPTTHYDHVAAQNDQTLITQLGGGFIEAYMPEALEILRSNQRPLVLFRERLTAAWAAASTEATFAEDPDSFELLTREEIEGIWAEC
jgi:hypothetical protein